MEDTARLFNCACCQCQVIICRYCDRGHIYCSTLCAQTTRQASHRAADQRYQNTRQGRHKHAKRQQRYRQRLTLQKEKVTDQGSTPLSSHDSLPPVSQPPKERTTVIKVDQVICHFCGRHCALFLRINFLQQSTAQKQSDAALVWPSQLKSFNPSSTGAFL